MAESVVELTDDNFDAEVLDSQTTAVLVDFWASWCGPCKMIAPIVEEIAADFKDRLKGCKINVDDQGQTAGKYSVESIPTLILFKDGKEKDRFVGALSKEDLMAKINAGL